MFGNLFIKVRFVKSLIYQHFLHFGVIVWKLRTRKPLPLGALEQG